MFESAHGWATRRDPTTGELSCSPLRFSWLKWRRMEFGWWLRKKLQALRMPDERAALRVLFDAHERLKQLGWAEAIYCPKDGSTFLVIEAGSTGTHRAHYQGKWPKGSWWAHDAGDEWPSRPILWKACTQPPQTEAANA